MMEDDVAVLFNLAKLSCSGDRLSSSESCMSTSSDESKKRSPPPNQLISMKPQTTWTEKMNVLLCRKVGFVNPFQYKEQTKERGKAWEDVAVNLQKHGHSVTKRAVRDRYKIIKENVKKRNSVELRESGIAPEHTDEQQEITQIVEDLVEVEVETKESVTDQQVKEEKKNIDGVEMRKRALETFTETNRRLKAEKDPPRKKRNTGNDANKYLLKKLEMERELKDREFDLRKDEIDRRRQDELLRREKEEREEERRRLQEEICREREEREAEWRRRDEERRREKEERDEERRRNEDKERDRRFEIMQQQMLQQSQMLMAMFKKLDKE